MQALSISTTTMSEIVLPQFSSSALRVDTDSLPVLPRFVSNNDADHDVDQRIDAEYPNSIAEISFVHRSRSAFQRINGVSTASQVCYRDLHPETSIHLPTFEENDNGTTVHFIHDTEDSDEFFLLNPEDLERNVELNLSSPHRISRKRSSPEIGNSRIKLPKRTLPPFRPRIHLRPKIMSSRYDGCI
jgi:hypothetical protein